MVNSEALSARSCGAPTGQTVDQPTAAAISAELFFAALTAILFAAWLYS